MLYVAAAIFGGITGFFMKRLTVLMITKRTPDKSTVTKPHRKYSLLVWIFFCSALWTFASFIGGISVESIRLALVGTLCMSLSAVDLKIRKIPNELLLSLLVLQIIVLIINKNIPDIKSSLGGLASGLVIFLLPAFIGKAAGLGDVKFAAVTGFILGFHGLIAAVLLMSILIIGYLAVLFITKKGGLKTKLALGPYLTAGTVAVMISTIILNVKYLDFSTLFIM